MAEFLDLKLVTADVKLSKALAQRTSRVGDA